MTPEEKVARYEFLAKEKVTVFTFDGKYKFSIHNSGDLSISYLSNTGYSVLSNIQVDSETSKAIVDLVHTVYEMDKQRKVSNG